MCVFGKEVSGDLFCIVYNKTYRQTHRHTDPQTDTQTERRREATASEK
jgi:hypothetical protein